MRIEPLGFQLRLHLGHVLRGGCSEGDGLDVERASLAGDEAHGAFTARFGSARVEDPLDVLRVLLEQRAVGGEVVGRPLQVRVDRLD